MGQRDTWGFDPAQVTDSPQVVVFRHCATTMAEPTDGAVVAAAVAMWEVAILFSLY